MRLALLVLVLAALLSWARYAIGDAEVIASELQVNEAVRGAVRAKEAVPLRTDNGEASEPQAMNGTPLFRAAVAPQEVNAPRAGETFALIGIVMREERRVAFLRDTVDGRAWNASAGGNVADWSVERIDERCVALKRRRRTQEICL